MTTGLRLTHPLLCPLFCTKQILRRGIAPPTPDAAAAGEASKARQHCRQRLARLVRRGGAAAAGGGSAAATAAVLLVPGGGGTPVRLPALLLALHSRLFLDMLQSGLFDRDEGGGGGGGDSKAAQPPPPRIPVDGVSQADLHALSRWAAGLLSLDALPLADLARVSDGREGGREGGRED